MKRSSWLCRKQPLPGVRLGWSLEPFSNKRPRQMIVAQSGRVVPVCTAKQHRTRLTVNFPNWRNPTSFLIARAIGASRNVKIVCTNNPIGGVRFLRYRRKRTPFCVSFFSFNSGRRNRRKVLKSAWRLSSRWKANLLAHKFKCWRYVKKIEKIFPYENKMLMICSHFRL